MRKLVAFAVIVAAVAFGGWTWDDAAHAASWVSKADTSQSSR